MDNECRKCADQLTDEDFEEFTVSTGLSIPSDFRQHYSTYNGGVPTRPCYPTIDGYEPLCMQTMKPIRPAHGKPTVINAGYAIQDTIDSIKDHIPNGFLPFANDYGGNVFCLDTQGGAIFWVPLDVGDEFETEKRLLAPDFTTFMSELVAEEDE